MPNVDRFLDETVADLRRRMALLADCGERRAIEDGIALLTDYRISGLDEPRLEALLRTLRSGRSPVRMSVLKPESLARELAQRWETFSRPAIAAHAT